MRLRGKTVLLLQSTALVSLDLQSMLEDEGATVVIKSDHADASKADLLMVDLDGARDQVAAQIHADGTPMVIFSGNVDGLAAQYPNAVIVGKPTPTANLMKSIERALSRRA